MFVEVAYAEDLVDAEDEPADDKGGGGAEKL